MSTHQITEKASSIATYTGGGSAVLFGLSANEFAAVIGAVVAVLGLLVNMWFRWQHLRIVRQAATARPDCATCPEREV